MPRPEPLKEPADTLSWNGPGVTRALANALAGSYPIPETLAWDLFLGVAPRVEYHPIYHPFNWRGWVDWGGGAIGDMGAHLIDHSMWALDLGYPDERRNGFDAVQWRLLSPGDADVLRISRARQKPPVKLTWYDGGLLPPNRKSLARKN